MRDLIQQVLREHTKQGKPPMFFIRNTSAPEADLKRNFSCYEWRSTYEEAVEYQKRNSALCEPKYDDYSKRWCADPEIGLSSFGFKNENGFTNAMVRMKGYAYDDKIALFLSDDYDLDAGLDSEDVFRDGRFLGYITWDTTFTELKSLV